MNLDDGPATGAGEFAARREQQDQVEVRRVVEAQIAPNMEAVRHYARAAASSTAPTTEAVLLTRYAAALSQDPTVVLGSPELVRDVAGRARRIVQDAGVTPGVTPQQLLRTSAASYEAVAKVTPTASVRPAGSSQQPMTASTSGIRETTARLRDTVTTTQPAATRASPHQDQRPAPTARPTTPRL